MARLHFQLDAKQKYPLGPDSVGLNFSRARNRSEKRTEKSAVFHPIQKLHTFIQQNYPAISLLQTSLNIYFYTMEYATRQDRQEHRDDCLPCLNLIVPDPVPDTLDGGTRSIIT